MHLIRGNIAMATTDGRVGQISEVVAPAITLDKGGEARGFAKKSRQDQRLAVARHLREFRAAETGRHAALKDHV